VQKQEFLSRWLDIIKKSSAVLVYKQDFVSRLLVAVRNCATRHTYDPAWARALVKAVEEAKTGPGQTEIKVDLKDTATRMIQFYWDQTVFFGLVQGANPCRQPELIRRVQELVNQFYGHRRPEDPVRFQKAQLHPELKDHLERSIDIATEVLSNDVVNRFLGKGPLTGEFVIYSRGGDSLLLPVNAAAAIKENSLLITEAVYYRWSQILEKYNCSPRLNKKVRIIDQDELRDRPLSYYTKYLDLENPGRLCFFCGQPVEGNAPNIGHLIPWSYLCSDDIWNLVYAHQGCLRPGARGAPPEFYIARLDKRNRTLLEKLSANVETDMVAGTLQDGINKNLLKKCWLNCQ